MRKTGLVSPTRAAKLIGVHVNTIYAWCALVEAGKASPLIDVRRDPSNGYLYIGLLDALRLRSEKNPHSNSAL